MEQNKSLEEFLAILGRIRELVGDVAISDDGDIDIPAAIQRLRDSGNDQDADELADLVERAETMHAQHQDGGSASS